MTPAEFKKEVGKIFREEKRAAIATPTKRSSRAKAADELI